jgi:hypothetical protein
LEEAPAERKHHEQVLNWTHRWFSPDGWFPPQRVAAILSGLDVRPDEE